MADTSHDRGMGADEPPARSARHTRRLAIVGALALVLVAGAVLVGVKTTGSRSGALTSSSATVTCAFVEQAVEGQPPPMHFPYDAVNLKVTQQSSLTGVVLTLNVRGGTANLSISDPDSIRTTTTSLGAAGSAAIAKSATYLENFSYWVSWTNAGVAYETAHGTACS